MIGERMTKDEFEQSYAARSGITVAQLRALGRSAEPCDCGDESCMGWQMTHDGSILLIRRTGGSVPMDVKHGANTDLALVDLRMKIRQ